MTDTDFPMRAPIGASDNDVSRDSARFSRRAALGSLSTTLVVAARPSAAVERGALVAGAGDLAAFADGRADATGAIQAAIDRLHAQGGGILALPHGAFRIAGTLRGRPGVSLVGQGSLATRLMKVGVGDCLLFGTGTRESDAEIERITLDGFSIVGESGSGHLFWGRKATTAFVMRDLYFEGGNSPVLLDCCYSLMMENVQVRAAETGDNIMLNAISHNVMLLQVASQLAKAGAGIRMTGCFAVTIVGGKLEFNGRDQLYIGNGCRGILITGLYVEGIQPIGSGYAGITTEDADSISIVGGFFDATQGADTRAMGTDGTGTYIKAKGRTSRLTCSGYGFVSVAASQRHVEIGAAAEGCDIAIPLGAHFINGAGHRNIVRFGAAADGPLQVACERPQAIRHGQPAALVFDLALDDVRAEWRDGQVFRPIHTAFYNCLGALQLADVPVGSSATITLHNLSDRGAVARRAQPLGAGSPTVDFVFRERLIAGKDYRFVLEYRDGGGRDRATTGGAASNRLSIERSL